MLFRLIGIEEAYKKENTATGLDYKPRQLLVTQSPVLAARIAEYYQKLSQTIATSTLSKEALAENLEERKRNEQTKDELRDDEDLERKHLPQKWSEMTDAHFPAFLSYSQLCRMLEADIGIHRGEKKTAAQRRAEHRYTLKTEGDMMLPDEAEETSELASEQNFEWLHQIRFETFVQQWPHFDARLTKNLTPSLVFNEIIGLIRGVEETLETPSGALSREAYLAFSARRSALQIALRHQIYDLFEEYMRYKTINSSFDNADRSHTLISHFRQFPLARQHQIDFLYVDEAQDNLLVDMSLMRSLCSNSLGFFIAGDTAQTVLAGSAFRFEDLSSFFYRSEEKDPLVLRGVRAAAKPHHFQLSRNFRSHEGIVNVGNFLTLVISSLWPYSIDQLVQEEGSVHGPKPVFFTLSAEKMRLEDFILGDTTDGTIEFGADSVILVRNDAARDALKQKIGQVGLVLTIYESKGLEFSNVLLWQFFEDSSSPAGVWRILLHFLQGRKDSALPAFDENRHGALCLELKHLYVAVTRARNHLWIFDNSAAGKHVRTLLQDRNLIDECDSVERMPGIQHASTPADWENLGRALFKQKIYHEAAASFDRGGHSALSAIARAYQSRQNARDNGQKNGPSSSECRRAFHAAGTAFLEAAKVQSAPTQAKSLRKEAAGCFQNANSLHSAGLAFEEAEEYSQALRCFIACKKVEDCARILLKHRKSLPEAIYESALGRVSRYLIQLNRFTEATELHDTSENLLSWMRDNGLDFSLIPVLKKLGKFAEAGEVAEENWDLLQAADLYLKDGKARQQALDCLFRYYKFTVAIPNNKSFQTLADRISQLASEVENAAVDTEILRWTNLKRNDKTALGLSLANFSRDEAPGLQMRMLFVVLHETPLPRSGTINDVRTFYQRLLNGFNSLKQATALLDRRAPGHLEDLGLFVTANEEQLRVLSNTPLANDVTKISTECFVQGDSVLLPANLAIDRAKGLLAKKYLEIASDVAIKLDQHPQMNLPCKEHQWTGKCAIRQFCNFSHDVITDETFNKRVFALCDQLRLLERVEGLDASAGATTMPLRRKVFDRLTAILLPLDGRFHSVRDLDPRWDQENWSINTDLLQNLFRAQLFAIAEGSAGLPLPLFKCFLSSIQIDPTVFPLYSTQLPLAKTENAPRIMLRVQRNHMKRTDEHINVAQDLVTFAQCLSTGQFETSDMWRAIHAVEFLMVSDFSLHASNTVDFVELFTAVAVLGARHGFPALQGQEGKGFQELTIPHSWARFLALHLSRARYTVPDGILSRLCGVLGQLHKSISEGGEYWVIDNKFKGATLSRIIRLLLFICVNVPTPKVATASLGVLRRISFSWAMDDHLALFRNMVSDDNKFSPSSWLELRLARFDAKTSAQYPGVLVFSAARFDLLPDLFSSALASELKKKYGSLSTTFRSMRGRRKSNKAGKRADANRFDVLKVEEIADEEEVIEDLQLQLPAEVQKAGNWVVRLRRAMLERRLKANSDSEKHTKLRKLYAEFQLECEKTKITASLLRLLLGPGFHLLLAIASMDSQVKGFYTMMKANFNIATGPKLDEVSEQLTAIASPKKQIIELQKRVSMRNLPQTADSAALADLVTQASALWEKIQADPKLEICHQRCIKAEVDVNLAIAYRGIVQVKRLPTPAPKRKVRRPALNTRDDGQDDEEYTDESEVPGGDHEL